jgi:uncharacterized protein (TIGR02996 family)
MAVYFVYRCYYNAPGERHVRRFEFDNVVEWVRSIWRPIPETETAYQCAQDLLGGLDGWMFGQIFLAIAEEGLPPPENMDQVMKGFWHLYIEQEDHGPHHLQILTEDDDNQVAIYLFDDHFLATAPGRTDFLLLDSWELPSTWSDAGPPCLPGSPRRIKHPGEGEGAVYTLSLLTESKYNLEDLCGGSRVEGARVPDLCRYVLTHPDEKELDYGLRLIRCTLQEILAAPAGEDAGFLAAIRDNPRERVHWDVYSDWLQDHDQLPAGLYLLEAALRTEKFGGVREDRNPALDRIKVSPHLAQACKHEGQTLRSTPPTVRDFFQQWIYFDDLWAAANPTLATGLLQFAARWDVLSTGPKEEGW